MMSHYYSKIYKKFPNYTVSDITLIPKLDQVLKSRSNNFGLFIISFVGLYNFGLYSCKKKNRFSLQSLKSSIYSFLINELCIYDLLEVAPKIIDIMEKLHTETLHLCYGKYIRNLDYTLIYQLHNLAYHSGTDIFNIITSKTKNRELDFWFKLKEIGIPKESHPFLKLLEKVKLVDKLKKLKKIIRPRYQWIYQIAKGCQKLISKCLILATYLNNIIPEKPITYQHFITFNLEEPNWFEDLDLPSSEHVYRQEKTGISDNNNIQLTNSIAKSIIIKSLRISPEFSSQEYEFYFNKNFILGKLLTFEIPKYYINDSHIPPSQHVPEYDIPEGFLSEFYHFRSLKTSEVQLNDSITLYQYIIELYFRCLSSGLEINLSNLRMLNN